MHVVCTGTIVCMYVCLQQFAVPVLLLWQDATIVPVEDVGQ